MFLNYIIFENSDKYQINRITDITVGMVNDFFTAYGKRGCTKNTVDRCMEAIMDFLLELIEAHPNDCKIRESDLITKTVMRT